MKNYYFRLVYLFLSLWHQCVVAIGFAPLRVSEPDSLFQGLTVRTLALFPRIASRPR